MSIPLPLRSIKINLFTPTALFLVVGILMGVLYSIFVPYGAGFDEEMHQIRIFDLTYRHWLPNRTENATRTYGEFFDLSYQRRYFNDPATDMYKPKMLNVKLDDKNQVPVVTRSIYSPVIFLPQSAVAFLGLRRLHLPVLPVILAERLAGLLVYLAGAYLAIRIIPFGKWVLAILALSPAALYQAATLNADGYTNAVCFLFVALTLQIYMNRERSVGWKQAALLMLMCVLISLAKPGYFMLLPLALLLLPPSRFKHKALYIGLWAALILAVVITATWMSVSVSNTNMSEGGARDLSRQLGLILADPLQFVSAYVKGIILSFNNYYQDWVGVYGYWVGIVPPPVYWIFPFALLAALIADPAAKSVTLRARLSLFAIFLISSGAIAFLYSYLHYTAETDTIFIRQGRYYVATAPLLFLSLAGLADLRVSFQKAAQALAVGLLAVTLGFYSLGLYATYFTQCGYSQFSGGACMLPQYKNLDKTPNAPAYMVAGGSDIRQTFIDHCGKISAIRILIQSVPAGVQGNLAFSLLDDQQRVLSATEIPVSQLKPASSLYLPVQPSVGTEGGRYEFRLKAPELTQPNGVGILMRAKDYYKEGKTYASGVQSEQDLVFNYVCPNRNQQ